jgi:hypothetical protein
MKLNVQSVKAPIRIFPDVFPGVTGSCNNVFFKVFNPTVNKVLFVVERRMIGMLLDDLPFAAFSPSSVMSNKIMLEQEIRTNR